MSAALGAAYLGTAASGCSPLNGGSVVFSPDAATAGDDSPARRGANGDGGVVPGSADARDAAIAPAPCPGCRVSVRYTCAEGMAVQAQRSFMVRLVNPTGQLIPLTSVKVRYWFTTADLSRQVFECDFAAIHSLQGTCADILPASSFVPVAPARNNANAYFEIGFDARAGALEALHDDPTDRIQVRLHDVAFTTADQRADYSYDCAMPAREIEPTRITAYVGGALVFGREPQ